MKKFKIVFFLLSMLALTLGLAACTGHEEHAYGEWYVYRESTCSVEGEERRDCKFCDEYEARPIETLAHTFGEWELTRPSTCAAFGEETRRCSVCNAPETRPVEKVAHTPAVSEGYEPTCDTEGREPGSYCSVCYEVLTERKVIPALGHDWDSWKDNGDHSHTHSCKRNPKHTETERCDYETEVTQPTCTTGGFTTYTCTRCENTYEDDRTDPLQHTYESWTHVEGKQHKSSCKTCGEPVTLPCEYDDNTVEPTCTEAGYTDHTCPLCGDSYRDGEKSELGHDYTGPWVSNSNGTHQRACSHDATHLEVKDCTEFEEVVVPAKCDAEGATKHVCRDCHYERDSVSIPKIDHTYNEPWTPSEGGGHERTCSVCGEIQTGECVYKDVTTDATCSAQGFTTHTCTYCSHEYKDSYTQQLAHTYPDEWTYREQDGKPVHERLCSVCKTPESSPCEMKPIEELPECLRPVGVSEVCAVCGHTDVEPSAPAPGHIWVWTHSYSEGVHTHTRTCSACEETESGTCNFTTTTQDASCTAAGKKTYTCTVCSHEYEEEITKLEHVFDQWRPSSKAKMHEHTCSLCEQTFEEACDFNEPVVTEPTCFTKGYSTHTCKHCSYSYTDSETDELEHVWGKWTPGEVQGTHTRTCEHGHSETAACKDATSKTEATCDSEGYIEHTCEDCKGSYRTDVVEALGHNYTWTPDGENFHKGVCTRNPAHTTREECGYLETETEPTCDEAGVISHSCLKCGEHHTHDGKPALTHNWGQWEYHSDTHTHSRICLRNSEHTESYACDFEVSYTVPATCQKAGYTVYECPECHGTREGDLKEQLSHDWRVSIMFWNGRQLHSMTCNKCGTKVSKYCEGVRQTVDATCDTDGYVMEVCSICHSSMGIRERIPKTGHDFTDYTYTGNDEADTHERTCRNCDYVEKGNCTLIDIKDAPTCTEAGSGYKLCELCHHTEDHQHYEALQHKWGEEGYVPDGRGNHIRTCTVCGSTESSPCVLSTVTTEADCEHDGIRTQNCATCGYENIEIAQPRLGHKWNVQSHNETEHYSVCERDATHISRGEHDFGSSNICDGCGYDGLTYERVDAHYVVSGDTRVPDAENILIPEEHDGLPVTAIAKYAFYRHTSLTTLVFPSTLEEIGDAAFTACTKLKDVSVRGDTSALKTIARDAFSTCSSLETAELPEGLLTIGDSAFSGCTRLINITVPDSVLDIGLNAFKGTAFLSDPERWEGNTLYIGRHLVAVRDGFDTEGRFELLDDTISVSNNVFENRTELVEFIIPASLKKFDSDAFKGCVNLNRVEYRGKMAEWFAIRFGNDYASPMHYASYLHIEGATGAIRIPEGITSIPAGTFRGTTITSVEIPETVTEIGAYAFYGCEELVSIDIPDTVKKIGVNAFYGTGYYLEEGNWSEGLLYIKHHLIAADIEYDFGEVTVRAGTLTMGAELFKDCKTIDRIVVAESVIWIGPNAFVGSSLTKAKFEDTTHRWFAYGIIGRSFAPWELGETSTASNLMNPLYNGEWRRL